MGINWRYPEKAEVKIEKEILDQNPQGASRRGRPNEDV